jgi:uronate dehydrogenase
VTVLLTGCSGRIGRSLSMLLPELGWQLRGFDREPADVAIEQVVADITDPDALDRAMAAVRAVVHLAGQPTEAPWPVIREAKIEGTFQVFEAARRAGVGKLVYASSNHAVGFTPRPATGELADDTAPRPDTLYGVSKVFGEALGRYYVDRYGMQIACLRIGTFAEQPPNARSLATWLSPGDCARLVDACLRSDDLTYALVWGISANRDRWWSADAGAALGYQPIDDAAGAAAELGLDEQRPDEPVEVVGGGFTDARFGIDETRRRAEEANR